MQQEKLFVVIQSDMRTTHYHVKRYIAKTDNILQNWQGKSLMAQYPTVSDLYSYIHMFINQINRNIIKYHNTMRGIRVTLRGKYLTHDQWTRRFSHPTQCGFSNPYNTEVNTLYWWFLTSKDFYNSPDRCVLYV